MSRSRPPVVVQATIAVLALLAIALVAAVLVQLLNEVPNDASAAEISAVEVAARVHFLNEHNPGSRAACAAHVLGTRTEGAARILWTHVLCESVDAEHAGECPEPLGPARDRIGDWDSNPARVTIRSGVVTAFEKPSEGGESYAATVERLFPRQVARAAFHPSHEVLGKLNARNRASLCAFGTI